MNAEVDALSAKLKACDARLDAALAAPPNIDATTNGQHHAPMSDGADATNASVAASLSRRRIARDPDAPRCLGMNSSTSEPSSSSDDNDPSLPSSSASSSHVRRIGTSPDPHSTHASSSSSRRRIGSRSVVDIIYESNFNVVASERNEKTFREKRGTSCIITFVINKRAIRFDWIGFVMATTTKPSAELTLDDAASTRFVRFFADVVASDGADETTTNGRRVVRFFDRKDFMSAHGDDATYIARTFYKVRFDSIRGVIG
jgi:hypothetical protein